MPAFSTRCSAVTVGAGFYKATMWSIEISADEIDVTNFETGGFVEYIGSYVQANWNFDIFKDSGESEFNAGSTGINAGKELTDLRMWYTGRKVFRGNLGQAAGNEDCFYFPRAVILGVTPSSAVRDAHRISVRGRNQGVFYYPEGVEYSGIDCDVQ